jgi:hypothetical protein
MASSKRIARRGFAGLEDLVSEVVLPDLPAPSSKHSASSPSSAGDGLPPSPSFSIRWKRVAILAGGILLLGWFVIQSNQEGPSSPQPVASNRTRIHDATPDVSNDVSDLPVPPSTSASVAAQKEDFNSPLKTWHEVRPVAGSDRVLSGSELNYCVAEKDRMTSLQSALDSNSRSQIRTFSQMVADFNARCSSYRYYTAEMERARAYLDAHRDEIVPRGRSYLYIWRASPAGEAAAPEPSKQFVTVSSGMSMNMIAALCGISLGDLRELNGVPQGKPTIGDMYRCHP